MDKELACPPLFYPDQGCWRPLLRGAQVHYRRRALCWGQRMLWGHGWVAGEFLMSQSGVKYQDQDGEKGPWWFKCRIFFFWSTSPSRTETNCILGQCLMKFLTASCGRGGCLQVPAAASAEGSGTDVTFRDRLCKENINIYLRIVIQRKAKLQSLGSSRRLREEENKVGGCIVALWLVPPQLHQQYPGGLHARLCGCCQAWHCCKSALTEQEKIFMGFFSEGKCFLPCRRGFAWLLQVQLEGYRMSISAFWMHLGLGNGDWQKCKV